MKIILISNGPTVLNHKLGSEIDKFDIVVRFNNFELTGYEEYIGKKTSWVCYRTCDDVKLLRPTEIDHAYLFMAYCKWTEWMKPVVLQQKAWFGSKATLVDAVQCFEIAKEIGLNDPMNEWPSVGALALGYFSKLYPNEIMTHGFYEDTSKHYFSRPMNDGKYHAWEAERAYLKSLKIPSLT